MMKKIVLFFLLFFSVLAFPQTIFAENSDRVVDEADLLTDSEEAALESLLAGISQSQEFDVVVVTVDSTDGKTTEAYADDYFDENGYGYGTNYDGSLLLIDMGSRAWHISTTGFGITALTDAGLDFIGNQFSNYLSAGKYEKAFESYANWVNRFVKQAKKGDPYDVGHLPKTPAFWLLCSILAVGTGLLIAAVWIRTQAKKLQTVHPKQDADDYLKRSSFQLLKNQSIFLYRTLHRVRINRNNGGSGSSIRGRGGGSSTHIGSSGRSHGGRGGRF